VAELSFKNLAFSVFSVAVTKKCCDASGYEKHYFRSGCSASEDAGVTEATTAVHRKSMEHPVAERSRKNVVFSAFRLAVMKKCSDACGDR
jgi:hypothetical protein